MGVLLRSFIPEAWPPYHCQRVGLRRRVLPVPPRGPSRVEVISHNKRRKVRGRDVAALVLEGRHDQRGGDIRVAEPIHSVVLV